MELVLYVAAAAVAAAAAGMLLLRQRRSSSPASAAPTRVFRPVPVVERGDIPGGDPVPTTVVPVPAILTSLRLLRDQQVAPEQRAELAARLQAVAMPPPGIHRLLSVDVMSGAASRELGDLVMTEPRLAARILGRANSAFYGLQTPITTIPHAITYLGVSAVRSMALAFLLDGAVTTTNPAVRGYCARSWSAAMLAADLCALLANRLALPDPGALGTQAILSFLGDLAAPALLADELDVLGELDLPGRLHFEQDRLGVSAVVLGTVMLRDWGLPEAIVREVEAVGRVVVTPVNPRDPGRASQRALVYLCGRIGEAVARGKLTDAALLDLADGSVPELYHLQGYLQVMPLTRLPALLKTPEVAGLLRRMIAGSRMVPAAH
jgi:HD-like signal output (HDOD) protein